MILQDACSLFGPEFSGFVFIRVVYRGIFLPPPNAIDGHRNMVPLVALSRSSPFGSCFPKYCANILLPTNLTSACLGYFLHEGIFT